jgi:transcriptional regulator GlxA family with amidase domain
VRLVQQMLALHKVRQSARTPHELTVLAAQITATARPLDRLFYALYGLSEAEIKGMKGG